MNKNIKLAVAGAVLALSASAANAGIIIPAGEWTVDLNGNVNAYGIWSKAKGNSTDAVTGGLASVKDASGEDVTQGINTGLLPAWLGVTGTTRQNDVDTSFTISMQPGVSNNGAAGSTLNPEFRQAFLTFGDKSWGSFKLGKDLGIFASDAILNDMTLLGVGSLASQTSVNSGTTTTLGGIGTGYIYAAWKGQIAYTTPNFNGFQATVGLTNPNQASAAAGGSGETLYQDRFGLEGKASYSFTGDALNGKVWVSGATYDVKTAAATSYTATAADIGANVNAGGFGLTGYYYKGEGAGTTFFGTNGAVNGNKRDSDGGYIQATYVLPTKTKLGLAYGISSLDLANTDTAAASNHLVKDNERMTVGLYHPLTKHLNLVAEWNNIESKAHSGRKNENNIGSLGAILFF
jgi:predicted porin